MLIQEIFAILNQPITPAESLWLLFINGGWLVFLVVILYGSYQIWLVRKQVAYARSINYVFLKINVPKENEQSLKAMEQFFSHLSGAHKAPDWYEKWFLGQFQLAFSLELISQGGFIQYIVRTPVHLRDMIESAIFAQYPDAEITETTDYALSKKMNFPNPEYNIWGTEFVLTNKDYFPTRTYVEFEDSLSQELKDPLAPLLETLSSIKSGEEIWMQILLTPLDASWQAKGAEAMNKMAGIAVKKKSKLAMFGSIGKEAETIYNEVVKQMLQIEASGGKAKADENGMKLLAPQDRSKIEAIHNKISKIGFLVKWRVVYIGKRTVFSTLRVPGAIVGAVKNFNSLQFNGFKPDNTRSGVKVGHYPGAKKIKAWKQNKLLHAYLDREREIGHAGYVLNTEELASIWHFPMMNVKTPQISKMMAKRSEPPVSMPWEVEEEVIPTQEKAVNENTDKDAPPENLPFV